MNAIRLRGVTKTFGKVLAVDDLSLDVPQGSVYGFIGPNGSGKTTTLRMIMNIILADRGTIEIFGEPLRGAATDRIGYLPEERGLYKSMKVRELLGIYDRLTREHVPSSEETREQNEQHPPVLSVEESERIWAERERQRRAQEQSAHQSDQS